MMDHDSLESTGFAPPAAGYPPGYAPPATVLTVPWEDRTQGIYRRWCATTNAVLFHPRAFFETAERSPRLGPAVTYSMLTAAVGSLMPMVVAVLRLIARTLRSPADSAHDAAATLGALAALPLSAIASALVLPWIFGALSHAILALRGGATRPFRSTVRVFVYAQACHLWLVIPFVGSLPALLSAVVSSSAGVAAVHRCKTSKAAVAVVLPPAILVFFGLVALMVVLASALTLSMHV